MHFSVLLLLTYFFLFHVKIWPKMSLKKKKKRLKNCSLQKMFLRTQDTKPSNLFKPSNNTCILVSHPPC